MGCICLSVDEMRYIGVDTKLVFGTGGRGEREERKEKRFLLFGVPLGTQQRDIAFYPRNAPPAPELMDYYVSSGIFFFFPSKRAQNYIPGHIGKRTKQTSKRAIGPLMSIGFSFPYTPCFSFLFHEKKKKKIWFIYLFD